MLRFLLMLSVAALFSANALAAVPTYTFARLWEFDPAQPFDFDEFSLPPEAISVRINDRGDAQVRQGWGSFSYFRIFRVLKGGVRKNLVESGFGGAGSLFDLYPLGIANDATSLYIGYWDLADPRQASLRLANGVSNAMEIAVQPDGAGFLSQDATLNGVGAALWARFTGTQYELNKWVAGATTPLATCAVMNNVRMNDAGTVAFECVTGSNGTIFRGTTAPFAVLVDQNSFTPVNPGLNRPVGITSDGTVGFAH